ncbi:MAG TPA: HIT family protein [Candidatus Binatus sp.]|nr:HIT family protein [Candidatus Binatus sp.]
MHHLADDERRRFLEDMSYVAKALALTFKPDKMNYELLGNGQPHMHWHLVPRYKSDPLWGRPIWIGGTKRKRLDKEAYADIVNQIRKNL